MKFVKLCALLLGFVAIVGAVYLVFYLRLVSIRDSTQEISDFLVTPKVSEALGASNTYENNLDVIKQYNEGIAALNADLYDDALFDSSLVEKICDAIPANVRLTSVSYSGGVVSMVFETENALVAAQLDKQLSTIEDFLYVFTRSVTQSVTDEDVYAVSIEVSLDTVDPDATTAVTEAVTEAVTTEG